VALFLSTDDIAALASPELVNRAARIAVAAETNGEVVLPARLDVDLPGGFLRVMPGALGELMGVKVMTLVRGVGNRYLLLVYSQTTGELIALLDADEVTRLRTAGITAAAAEVLQPTPQQRMALIGSGFEATTHIQAMARLWPLESVAVYSPTPGHREGFAKRQADELEIDVRACGSCAEALASAETVVLATKANQPVIDGQDLRPNSVVLSIGSTRRDLRELDRRTFRRAAAVAVDDEAGVLRESGDVIDAVEHGAIAAEKLISVARAMRSPRALARSDERDLLVFKSVGTAVQDLALAGELIAAATPAGLGRQLGELTRLKAAPQPQSVAGEVV
jgi:ornithine cyclodeaminase/alanine dehydrogenase